MGTDVFERSDAPIRSLQHPQMINCVGLVHDICKSGTGTETTAIADGSTVS